MNGYRVCLTHVTGILAMPMPVLPVLFVLSPYTRADTWIPGTWIGQWRAKGWTTTHSADSEPDIRAKMSRLSCLARLVHDIRDMVASGRARYWRRQCALHR